MHLLLRFTQRAQHVLSAAHEFARYRGDSTMNIEHVFVMLAREGGIANRALRDLGLDPDAVDAVLDVYQPPGEPAAPLPADVERLLEAASREARAMGHEYVGTEHLLLGLLQFDDARISRLLAGKDITTEMIRQRVESLLNDYAAVQMVIEQKQFRFRVNHVTSDVPAADFCLSLLDVRSLLDQAMAGVSVAGHTQPLLHIETDDYRVDIYLEGAE